jgi:hypothetical protein
MWLAIAGLFFMHDKSKSWLWPTIVTMAISIYIIFSWWCWWYGGGFGARALVEFYVIMSLPLGAFFTFISQAKFIPKILTIVVLIFFIRLNIFQLEQYRNSTLHYDSMSKKAYWAVFYRKSRPEDYEKMLIHLDAEKAKRGESAYP